MKRLLGLLGGLALAAGWPQAGAGGTVTRLEGMDAAKFHFQRGEYDRARFFCYTQVWDDLRKPEALYYIARCDEKLGETEAAAGFYHVALRVLEEDPKDSRAAARKALCEKALKPLDAAWRADQKKYADTAAGKKFTSPQDVGDLWMTQVKCDLRSPHGLYAWKLIGGRKNTQPDWIHNAQGVLHRSAAKYMDDIDGRHGVLFCIPSKKSNKLSSLVWTGPVKGSVLRIGTKAYGFPYVLNVLVGGQQVFTKTVGKDAWEDLKVPLDPRPAADAAVTLELVVPENQRSMEGLFFDYVDFFDN